MVEAVAVESNPKKDKSTVNYRIGQRCSSCVYYAGYDHGGSCELVSGNIVPEAVCDLWSSRASYVKDYNKAFFQREADKAGKPYGE